MQKPVKRFDYVDDTSTINDIDLLAHYRHLDSGAISTGQEYIDQIRGDYCEECEAYDSTPELEAVTTPAEAPCTCGFVERSRLEKFLQELKRGEVYQVQWSCILAEWIMPDESDMALQEAEHDVPLYYRPRNMQNFVKPESFWIKDCTLDGYLWALEQGMFRQVYWDNDKERWVDI